MEFVEVILLLLMILIFIVIIFNVFAYGRDLVIFPRMRRVSEKERYPGSPDYDEYSEDDSDSEDEDDYHHKQSKKHIHPRRIAQYVSSHMH